MASIRPTEARISLSALAHNLRCLRGVLSPAVGVVAVVKADAYGHGAVQVARLLEGLGVQGFGVATVEEGVELREAGIRSMVLIMGAAYGDDHGEVVARELTPMVGVVADLERFAEAARRAGQLRFSVHVKVDTGMTRLGVTHDQFEAFLRHSASFPTIRVDGLATHFAAADEQDPEPTERQLRRFVACLDQARALGADPQVIHAANSGAVLCFPRSHFDLVRPGIALYGALPGSHMTNPGLRPVMSLHTRINALRQVPAGTRVSYGGSWTTSRPATIATLPLGYADGYPRSLSNRAQVVLDRAGQRAPLVGAVCMDLCMVDVTDTPAVEVGDAVTLLGGDGPQAITPDELARWAGTISYELLCGIGKRVPRVAVEGGLAA